jgi:protein ImuB
MSRIVSVWLKAWPMARLLSAQASSGSRVESKIAERIDPSRPLVLVAPGVGGARVVALNRAAQRGGVVANELLSNARSKVLDLQTRDADPAADAAALRKLALWCLRYAPLVAPWDETSGADGLFLDITGCAHLFGGEAQLLADLARRLTRFGLVPRLAVADTAGAAWAMVRHGPADGLIVPPGREERALRPLPLAALRLSDDTRALLRRLGFRRIGELIGKARAPFAARFEKELLLRLDQALGQAPEPLAGISAPPVYRAFATFLEPISSQEHVLEAATQLLDRLAEDLMRDGAGARTLRLILFRVDGKARFLDIGLAAPSRDARHIARLIALRLDRLGDALDADFGFEAAAVHVLVAEPLDARQTGLAMDAATPPPEALPQLIDRLQQRLGADAVRSLHPHPSHIPERAVRARPFDFHPDGKASKGRNRRGVFRNKPQVLPPPCGEGSGVGGAQEGNLDRETLRATNDPLRLGLHPTPNPSPSRGGGSGRRMLQSPATHRSREAKASPSPQGERKGEAWGEGTAPRAPRPLLLFPRPEAAEVMALIPEGPPRQFRWRGVVHQVTEAQGPERITPEWWRRTGERTRDYYVVEDTAGRRFWIYRAGLYDRGDDARPAWFVHGVFG